MDIIIQKQGTFIFFWITSIIALLPLFIVLFRWHAKVSEVRLEGSELEAIIEAKILATAFSIVAVLFSLFVFFKTMRGGLVFFKTFYALDFRMLCEAINEKLFLVLWLVSSLFILLSDAYKKRGITKFIFWGFIYNAFTVLFSAGLVVKKGLIPNEGNLFWFIACFLIFRVRYSLWKKGV